MSVSQFDAYMHALCLGWILATTSILQNNQKPVECRCYILFECHFLSVLQMNRSVLLVLRWISSTYLEKKEQGRTIVDQKAT